MLLVLSTPEDDTGRRFAAHAGRCGVPLWGGWDDDVLSLCATSGRDGQASAEIWCRRSGVRARGILNRGVCPGPAAGDAFSEAESLASWWSALAVFPGRVVNRPSRRGFVPVLDVPSLTRGVPGLGATRITYGARPAGPSTGRVNIHRLRDGQWLGASADAAMLDPSEVYAFTEFEPGRVVHVLWAGRRLFDLGSADGMPDADLRKRLDPLTLRLHHEDVTFALAVFERSAGVFRLVHATAFPSVEQYRRWETPVHDALLEYLLS